MTPVSMQRRDESQSVVLTQTEIPHAMDRCARIAKVREYFDRVMWLSLTVSGASWGGYALLGGSEVSALKRVRTPALVTMGSITAIAALGKFITGNMLQKCTNRILDHYGARPTTSPTFDAPDVEVELIDPDERSIVSYGVRAEAIARRATRPTVIAKGVLIVAAATQIPSSKKPQK